VISILYVSVTAGVGIKIPSGRDIDGKYLDENVKEIHNEIQKWKPSGNIVASPSCVIPGPGL